VQKEKKGEVVDTDGDFNGPGGPSWLKNISVVISIDRGTRICNFFDGCVILVMDG